MNEDDVKKIAQQVYIQNQQFDSFGMSYSPTLGGNISNNTVDADKLNVNKLSAITADLGTITAGSISVINGANTIGLTPTGTYAIFSGTTGNPQFKVTPAGVLTATGASISGGITASSIDIPDVSTANSFHVNSSGDTWWGATTFGSALASISKAGAAIFTSISISGIVNNTATDISLLEFSHNLAFTSASATQINWSSGTIVLSNGRTFTISSGNTGTMAAATYIYLDTGVSLTVLQTTTTYSTAMGANKILIATAQNNATAASCVPFGGGQPVLDGAANIGALSITAASIAASTITAGKISVSTLSAIQASTGALTVGTSGSISSGQSAYNTGTGYWLEYNGGTPRISIGNPAGNYVTWDGSALSINGLILNYTGTVASDTLVVSADTEQTGVYLTYTKVKEIIVRLGGTIRVSFDLKCQDGNGGQLARVYVDGVAVGTEQSSSSTVYATFTQDFSIGSFSLVQLYIKQSASGLGKPYIQNFRIHYDVTSLTQTTVNLN